MDRQESGSVVRAIPANMHGLDIRPQMFFVCSLRIESALMPTVDDERPSKLKTTRRDDVIARVGNLFVGRRV